MRRLIVVDRLGMNCAATQQIHTQLADAGEDSIAFLLLGQRFVFDSSVLGDLVYGSLATNPPRLMPTPLDVGLAVFHNPAAQTLLAEVYLTRAAPGDFFDNADHRTAHLVGVAGSPLLGGVLPGAVPVQGRVAAGWGRLSGAP